MPPYHSSIKVTPGTKTVGKVPILPLRITSKGTNTRGPAPQPLNANEPDIVDESLDLFKANILFTSFEVAEPSDLVLVYVTLYVLVCLKRLAKAANRERAGQEMYALAVEKFAIPGDRDFPLNAYYERPRTSGEADELRRYLTQVRSEVGARLVERVFDPKQSADGKPSKWWLCFARRKFLKTELVN